MSQWDEIYANLQSRGVDAFSAEQRAGTAWIDEFLPLLGTPAGESLDLGCGMGSDMLRYAELGWRPTGVDLSTRAVEHVRQLGFDALQADLSRRLPFEDQRFELVTGRCSLHFLPPAETRALFGEIRRVLKTGGRLLFIVNSDAHRAQRLQYDYEGARRLDENYWEIPSIGRRYLFYTPELAADLLADGWKILHLSERPFQQWGIEKRVVACVAERTDGVA